MEVETPHGESLDSFGRMTALQTAILAVLLSVFTICSHRMHTEIIVLGNEASNQWSHYQAKRIRDFQLQLNTEMMKLTAPASAEVTKSVGSIMMLLPGNYGGNILMLTGSRKVFAGNMPGMGLWLGNGSIRMGIILK